ncbi:MAG: SdrD B-like domain-containing protein, partial [Acidimicrobiales bacterium]
MVASLLFASTTPVAAGPPPVLTVYVPIPEDDIQSALAAMAATSPYTIGPDIQTIISITVAADGGLIYYDHWEDGYEADIANPVQPSTEVWGDNDASNGIPPGYATDVIGAGSVLVLDNGSTLSVPRHTTANPPVAFDARDKVASDRGFALTRAGWEDTYGTLHAGAIAAYDTSRFGTSFEFPIGEDVASGSAFEYTALSVMAASDGTSLTIDIDGDGTFETNTTLDEGETAFIDGGIQSGGTMRTSHPVQAALLTGDVGATFEGRWFELFPMELLSDNYVAATGTTEATNEPVIFLYNPALFDITVDVTRSGGVDQVVVPSKTAVSYLMPNGSGGNFSSVGAPFFALSATGALADSGSAASSSENDWGYALVPESLLTAGVVVGWGPGSWQPPSGTQTQNMSPVWVAALADTTLNIDYDNDGTVDATQPVTAFESVALYDSGDNDMTGAAIFTTDGTRITASWGQDPATASPGTPALDLGSAVVPSTVLIVDKSAELTGDVAGDGVINPGDTVHFTIDVFDASALSLTNVTTVDDLAAEFDYVDNSTQFNGVPLPDDLIGTPFPLDGTGHVVPTMAPGSSVRYEFDARITGAWPDTAIGTTNTVITTALEGDGVDTVGIPVELDDLAISKSGPTDPVSPGETITYTIDVTNLGASAQTNVTIGDVLPSEVDFVSASLTVPSPGSGGFVMDATDVASFSNDDGSLSWAGPWAEVDNQGAGPTNGSIRFLTSGGANGGGYFRLRNANNSMTRGIDTTNYDEGTLSLEFSRRSMSFNDSVALEVSSDGGGSWTELRTFAGPADDPGYLNYTTDISAHLGGDFQLRFVSNGSMNNGDSVYFSDLRIDLVSRDVITTDAGTGPTFASGVTLLPYETATVEIVATVNATAAGLQFFDNIATASSTTDGPLEAPVRTFVALGSLGDTIFADDDGDGTQDAGEPGLVGVTVELLDGTGTVIAADVTNASGLYAFEGLAAGNYSVRVDTSTLPADTTTLTADPDATPDGESSVTLGVGVDIDTLDFGFQPLGTIGDTVWADDDGDGVEDAGEFGIAGVTVELLNGTGTVIDTDVTDAGGVYGFADLVTGSYSVRVDTSTLPVNATTATADRDGSLDDETAIALAAGEDVSDADFGYQPVGAIGDRVWADDDGDGVEDAGESGIAGVTVELLDGTGTVIGTDVTDASGAYLFTGLGAGTYTVRVDTSTLPADTTTQSGDPDTTLDGEGSAILLAGTADLGLDFGYQPLGTIGDTVYSDVDGDGTQDAGEPGLAGVTVELLDGTGTVIDTDVTDGSGVYGFADLPAGDYTVRVNASTLPADTTTATADRDATADGETDITLAGGEDVTDADFGYQPLGSIGDRVWSDDDGDGVQDAGEPGLSGVTVELLNGTGTVIGTDVTDGTGDYGFADLPAGSYTVRVDTSTLPADTTSQTGDRDATLDDETTLTLAAGEDVADADFGYQPLGTIGDTVYSDVDGDGTQDAGEPGLSGVTVELLDAVGTVIATDVTDGTGDYGFADLAAGDYTVRVDTTTLPSGVTQTDDRDATLDDETSLTLSAGQDVSDADFGYEPAPPGSIGDRVWSDVDGDGVQDAGEPGLAGVTVELLDGTGTVIATATTDLSGNYSFTDLPAASYSVRVDVSTLPADTTTQTGDPDATLDDTTSVTLDHGDNVATADFGYQPLGTIGDRVWSDVDGDGVQDAGEPGLSGVTVELLDGTGTVIGTDVTDGTGDYGFADLAADSYTVRVDTSTLPGDTTTQTGDRDATLDDETTIALAGGADITNADFGYQPLGTIGDTVYSDVDGDGVQDAGEPGLSGVTVELLDGTGTVIGTDVTDASGLYGFADLPAESYTVRVDTSTLPAGVTQTDDPDATVDDETTLTLAAGEDVTTADFGYEPPVLATLGDTIFNDQNGDGVQDATDPGLAGVTVELLDGTGTVIATDVTDAAGNYLFPGLTAGTYTVRVDTSTLPFADIVLTYDPEGVEDHEAVGTVDFGDTFLHIDFGYMPFGSIGDTVFADVDGDGVQDAGEPGIPGVTVEVLDSTGTTVYATETTDATGSYTFAGVPMGNFIVRVDTSTLPADTTTQTADPDATLDDEHPVALGAGEDIDTVDFGYQPLGTIGDTVYSDVDGDGTQDAGEPGLSGVTVELLNGTGTVIDSDVTDGTGDYGFADLPAGSYSIRVDTSTLPAGVTQTADRDATLDDETAIALAAGQDVSDADFGYEPPVLATIGDTVFADENGSGVQGAGEPGIPGVTVELLDGTGTVIATDVTDASGVYGFTDLTAGTYTVRVDTSTLPSDTTTQTADPDATLDDASSVTLAFGDNVTTVDFGYQPLGTIGDRVWADLDGDGIQDAGEPGLSGVTVELLDGTGTVIGSDVTDASGAYGFGTLPADDYTVRVDVSTLPADTTTQTGDPDATLDDETDITLAAGQDVTDADFGYQPLGTIGDTVYSDVDGNGAFGAGDSGLSGVTVELLNSSGTVIGTDVADASGVYGFADLPAADYTVRVDTSTLPAGMTQTDDRDATLDDETDITLAAGQDVSDADFGYEPPVLSSIGDRVWADADGDGVQDAGEPGVPGVTVELLDGTGTVVATDVTDGTGLYGFAGLTAGTYTVRVDTSTLPADTTTQTGDRDATLDDETAITLGFATDITNADFGYQPLGTIGDRVWADLDGDGIQDVGEPGLSGVTVELLDAVGTVIASDVTDGAGAYTFSDLVADDYTVRVDTSTVPVDTTTQTGDPDATIDGETSLTLAAGDDITTADFGFQPLGSIGDTVYSDVDGDGTQDAGEPGLSGVTVELLDAVGTVIATDVTDTAGDYGFVDLPAGDYTVRVEASTLPGGVTQTDDRDATLDDETTITLAGGADITNADFGYEPAPLGSIGDRVWSDDDGDGIQDAGEPGLAGVTVELLDGTGTVIASDVTDASGDYGFAGLTAGTYTVRVDSSTLPGDTTTQTGDRDATLDDETMITLGFGTDVTDADFGYQPLGTIGDTVYSDTDGDGVQDAGEPGLASVTVELLNGTGVVIATDVTDAAGDYGFADLPAADYTVRVDGSTLPAGVTQTDDRDAILDDETDITLAAGEDVSDADFGYEPPVLASVGDRVWSDLDGDGVQDAGEPGLSGVTVELLDGTGTVIATDVTNVSGVYTFTDLAAGSYSVRVDTSTLPADTTTQTGDPDATLDSASSVTLAFGDNVNTVDFGYQPLGTIGDRVWADVDGDGTQDAGEPGLSGVTVELLDAVGTVIGTDVTDGTGDYGFAGLPADDYTVRVDTSTLPADTTTQTGDRDATLDDETDITLAGGADVTNADFGYQPLGTIGDTVYSDVDGDGVQDAGEPGLSGVTVELLDAVGTVIASDVTDASGVYGFTGLAADDYTVRVDASTLPAGVTQTDDRDATLDDETDITLAAGDDIVDADFGYEPAAPSSIGDTVFADVDGDGTQDAGDSGIAGVTVELLDAVGTVIASDVTDASGVYGFTGLAAGDYTVRVDTSTLPADTTTQTADRDASLDGETSVTLGFGTDIVDADFGYQPLGSIGDRVWSDVDGDGTQDAGEPGLSGVTVELLDGTGTVITSDVTDGTGDYGFTGLAVGDYTVRVDTSTLPADTTTQTGDRDATLDDETDITLAAGADVTDADFGYQPLGSIGDRVWSDVDGDGIQDAGEPGLAGVTVELLDAVGTVIGADVTDGSGDYTFTGLAAGDYSVRVDASTLPAGVTQTGDRDATLDDETAITLTAGADVTDADFGYQPLGSIGDTVFADVDGDGTQDAGEPGLSGVTVELLDAVGTVVATDTTDGTGAYGFTDLPADDYSVRVDTSTLPADTTTQTGDRDATLDDETAITLTAGADVTDADFGYQPLGTIGDRVWSDTDADGIQDAGEPGLSGVTVELLDGTGTVIASDVTDGAGNYAFAGLAAGAYTVRVDVSTLPTGVIQTGDPDATLDDESTLTLAAGEDVTTADFGYQPLGSIGDLVYSDADGNGAFSPGDSGLSG